MALTDLEGIISKIVMYDIWQLLAGGEVTENAAIIVQKLLLGLYFATTEAFLHEISHLRILNAWLGDL